MFSGIVEAQGQVIQFLPAGSNYALSITCPSEFDDLRLGDSVAVDGVCLTVEKIKVAEGELEFSVGPETLQITRWVERLKPSTSVNLERSLRFGDRVHGHMVTGHVASIAPVNSVKRLENALLFRIEVPVSLLPLVWTKGSLAVNGVSLTVNKVEGANVEFCLIPETLKRTNLSRIEPEALVNIEPDFLARGIARLRELETKI